MQIGFIAKNHCINLAIAFACKNANFFDSLTIVCYYFANSPKRQQYFERFIDSSKDEISLAASSRNHIIGLSEIRWVERYKAHENYYFLFKFIVATFDSICNPHLYEDLYKYLENETNENWYWDSESINKVQDLFAVSRKFDHIIAFSVLFHRLEPIKPIITKLQKRNQDICQAYRMIDKILSDLRDIQSNIIIEFKVRFTFTVDMAKSVGLEPTLPRTGRCWSRYRNNVPGKDTTTEDTNVTFCCNSNNE